MTAFVQIKLNVMFVMFHATLNSHILRVRLHLHYALWSAVSFIGLDLGGLHYSIALQRPTGQTVLLQAIHKGHMRSKDYSTTKIFVDNFLFIVSALNQSQVDLSQCQISSGIRARKKKKIWVFRSDLPVFKRGYIRWSHPPQPAWSWGCGLLHVQLKQKCHSNASLLTDLSQTHHNPQISHIPPKECLVFLLFDLVTVGGRRWETNGGGKTPCM